MQRLVLRRNNGSVMPDFMRRQLEISNYPRQRRGQEKWLKKPVKNVDAHITTHVTIRNAASAGGKIQNTQSVPTAQRKKSRTANTHNTE